MIRVNPASVPGRINLTRPSNLVAPQFRQLSRPATPPVVDNIVTAAPVKKPKPQSKAERWETGCNNIEGALSELESIRDELENWLDAMPQGLRDSSKGVSVGETLDACRDAIENIQETLSAARDVEFSY